MATLAYIIFYIADIQKAISFYQKVFGYQVKMLHESKQYVEIDTGATTLAFASQELALSNLAGGFIQLDLAQPPQACTIVLIVDDVPTYYKKACALGGITIAPPEQKPWAQLVAYVKDPNGVLVEIASPLQ